MRANGNTAFQLLAGSPNGESKVSSEKENIMREIKFRAWLPKSKQMLYKGSLMDLWGYSWLYDGGLASAVPMQYTGLKDKNGKEGYFDDIVQWGKAIYQIVWIEGIGQLKYISGKEVFRVLRITELAKGEIIGNIYENPELV